MTATIQNPDTASLPELIAAAAITRLSSLPELSGLKIAAEKTNEKYSRPIVVVSAETSAERIPASGVFSINLRFSFETTDATSDSQLVDWDGALWQEIADTLRLPARLNMAQTGIFVHAALQPSSSAASLSEKRRDISYQVELIAQKTKIENHSP